ncbi:MAG: hypothetical protein K6G01_06275 [Eubacterium sp.]|nr:hypothetical protein [Eubacterium sp.]
MSSFLGPIHFWLYNKIQLQEALVTRLATCAEEYGWGKKLVKQYGNPESRPLEDLIDVNNIHGWLQSRIQDVESRYAQLVTSLIKEDATRMESIRRIVYEFGAEHAIDADTELSMVIKKLEDSLLSGMPCDHVNVLKEEDEQHVSWEEVADIHGDYWKAADGDPAKYYDLKQEMIAGLLSETPYKLVVPQMHQYKVQAI